MKRLLITSLLLLLVFPFATAQEAEDETSWWDLANLISSLTDLIKSLFSSLPEKLFDYFLFIINAPLLPMLAIIKKLLTAEVSIDLFYRMWSMIRYILSFFYIFLFLYCGFVFLTSNANPIKRAHAKDMLKDTFLMIILIQGSFYIYGLVLSLGSTMDAAILSMIDPHFFLLTVDNFVNVGLELIFALAYAIALFVTMFMLVLRYIIVSFGVVLFPIGIFFYFTPPLKGYGRFILHLLGLFVFVTFFDLLIILACSMIVEIPLFANFKILVMITCFQIVNYTLWLAIKFALKKSTNTSLKDDLNQTVKYIALLA